MICCFGKGKYLLRLDTSKDHCKGTDLLRFVLLLPKQQIIVQVSYQQTLIETFFTITNCPSKRQSKHSLQAVMDVVRQATSPLQPPPARQRHFRLDNSRLSPTTTHSPRNNYTHYTLRQPPTPFSPLNHHCCHHCMASHPLLTPCSRSSVNNASNNN